jgi:uracil-DNA glycosylase family 4
MDAKAELRRLLQQRLEAGESTMVLDSLTASQIAVILSEAKEIPRKAETNSFAALRMTETPASPVRETLDERRAGPPAGASDWRTTLQTLETGMPAQPKAPPPPARTGKVVVTPDAPIPPMHSLDDVRAAIGKCTRCALYASALNHVPGEGNPNADFMVVGEAPGQTEDETGKPFVGRAGQLLTQILAAIKLSRDDVFICNVLKHRPPGNRNPEPDEVRACSPYLVRQIELIRPKVILALGTFSAQTLLDTKISIGKLRGQVHEYHGVPVVVTYHPAALLRNPAWKKPTWEDVQLARRILDSPAPRG